MIMPTASLPPNMWCLIVLLVEIVCKDPPSIDNSTLLSQDDVHHTVHHIGDEETYVCDEGLRFEDGSTHKTITCRPTGLWVEEKLTCKGV